MLRIPIEATYGSRSGATFGLQTTWDFEKEPEKGQTIDVGGGFFIVIGGVKYANDSDGYVERIFTSVDNATHSYLLRKGWTIIT